MILESVNGKNLKIIFDPIDENLLIGDLLKVVNKNGTGIVGQILNIETLTNDFNNIASIEILLSINPTNIWTKWIGNIPSKENSIQKVSGEELLAYTNRSNKRNLINLGNLSLYNTPNYIDALKLEAPSVAFCDNQDQKIELITSLAANLANNSLKTVILDFKGEFSNIQSAVKLEIGKDLKLPLNSKGIDLIYKKTLADMSLESKTFIEDIFMEVQDYADSCEQGFIPFSSFREVVEAEYKDNNLTELIILKNSLSKLNKLGVYANDNFEVESLKLYLENSNFIILDFSKINSIWHKDFVEFIINSNINNNHQEFFMVFEAKQNNIDTELMDKLFIQGCQSGIKPIISADYNSPFINNIMPFAKNIFFGYQRSNTEIISNLNSLLKRLNSNEFIIYGDISDNIPIIVNLNNTFINSIVNNPINTSKQVIKEPATSLENTNHLQEIVKDYVYHVNSENKPVTEENTHHEINTLEQAQNQPISCNEEIENFEFYQDDFSQENNNEFDKEDILPEEIIIEEEHNIPEEPPIEYSEEVYEDLDNIYSSSETQEEIETQFTNYQPQDYSEAATNNNNDSSLDLPIYSANDARDIESEEPDFQEGDAVVHQRYGRGIIKKIIGYGNKYLFSINFEEFGKKLLDPELAVIEKA